MSPDNIFMFDGEDPKMIEAYKNAQSTFKYFWRELSWENRRIVPGLDLAAVKVAFKNESNEGPSHEHMWLNEIEFEGGIFTAILMNEPQWVTKLKPGERVNFQLSDISDWMYAVQGKVCGAYTVNLMRSEMSKRERNTHDKAWGLDFGDPNKIDIFHKVTKKKSIFSLFKKEEQLTDEELMGQEHPMCINMGDSLKDQLKQSTELIEYVDSHGNSMLHTEALAGNSLVIEILLEFGANPNTKNKNGQKPIDLARVFKWDNVEKLLT